MQERDMLNQERDFNETPRKWTAVRVDETGHCSDDFVASCGGKVYQVYLFDANEVTYCCSTTPAYCLYPVAVTPETYPEDEGVRESLFEKLLEAMHGAPDVSYMDCSMIDRLPEEDKAGMMRWLRADDGEDEAIEFYQGNPDF
jgi:hypothetical protein